jgi:hypothetical protein
VSLAIQVQSLINGTFDVEAEIKRLRAKGKSEDDIKEWYSLASEVVQAINSKQLIPTMRTQYMRVAFQIPFDATVRVSLDTNLCMISERTEETTSGNRWYRDPNVAVPLNEITRFPHAVLEVKLQLEGEDQTPQWVTDLINSGMLMEVHKFSKFIHGSAVLLPEEVRAVPYWIDDPSLRDSIVHSGAEAVLNENPSSVHFSQLLPHDASGGRKAPVKRVPAVGQGEVAQGDGAASAAIIPKAAYEYLGPEDDCCERWGCEWASRADSDHMTQQKVCTPHSQSQLKIVNLSNLYICSQNYDRQLKSLIDFKFHHISKSQNAVKANTTNSLIFLF